MDGTTRHILIHQATEYLITHKAIALREDISMKRRGVVAILFIALVIYSLKKDDSNQSPPFMPPEWEELPFPTVVEQSEEWMLWCGQEEVRKTLDNPDSLVILKEEIQYKPPSGAYVAYWCKYKAIDKDGNWFTDEFYID